MKIQSEPQQFTQVAVVDIDVAYPGDLQAYCVREGQSTYEETPDAFTITFDAGGVVVLQKATAHWYAIRPRMQRMPVPDAATVMPQGKD